MFWKIAKIDHNAWAIAFAKCSVWVKNYKSKKGVNTASRTTLELFCAKNGLKKHLIFKKGQVSEIHQNWSQSMVYSVCEMLRVGQKLKF